MDQRPLTLEEQKALVSNLIYTIAKKYLLIGWFSGLLVGWIAGGLVMLGLAS